MMTCEGAGWRLADQQDHTCKNSRREWHYRSELGAVLAVVMVQKGWRHAKAVLCWMPDWPGRNRRMFQRMDCPSVEQGFRVCERELLDTWLATRKADHDAAA